MRAIVAGAGCGVIVDTTRPEAIARGLREVLADPVEADAMGARGRAAVADRLNWSHAAAVLRAAYHAI